MQISATCRQELKRYNVKKDYPAYDFSVCPIRGAVIDGKTPPNCKQSEEKYEQDRQKYFDETEPSEACAQEVRNAQLEIVL